MRGMINKVSYLVQWAETRARGVQPFGPPPPRQGSTGPLAKGAKASKLHRQATPRFLGFGTANKKILACFACLAFDLKDGDSEL